MVGRTVRRSPRPEGSRGDLTLQGDLLQLLQEAAMAEDGDQPVVWGRTGQKYGSNVREGVVGGERGVWPL